MIMKKITLLTVAFLSILVLNSCTSDELEQQQTSNTSLKTVPPAKSFYKGDQSMGVGTRPL